MTARSVEDVEPRGGKRGSRGNALPEIQRGVARSSEVEAGLPRVKWCPAWIQSVISSLSWTVFLHDSDAHNPDLVSFSPNEFLDVGLSDSSSSF